jgi:esterase/lipase superfamily enzyme
MKFLETLKQFYTTEKEVYSIAKEFASLVDKDPARLNYAEEKISSIDKKLEEVDSVIADVKAGINIDDIPNIGSEDQTNTGDKYDKSLQTPDEKQADAQHAQVKDIKSGKTGDNVFENPPIPGAKRGQ